MRRYFFEILAVALIAGSLFFFKETLDYLARRDYVAAEMRKWRKVMKESALKMN